MPRVLMVLGHSRPIFCTEADIKYWESLNPTRGDELKLITLFEEDPARMVRPAMRLALQRRTRAD